MHLRNNTEHKKPGAKAFKYNVILMKLKNFKQYMAYKYTHSMEELLLKKARQWQIQNNIYFWGRGGKQSMFFRMF